MKKLIAILCLTTMLLLTACTPGNYSKELLKQIKKEYLTKAKEWFEAEHPELIISVMEYDYDGSSLHNLVKGSYKKGGKYYKYKLNPDTGDFFSEELYDRLETYTVKLFLDATGLKQEQMTDCFVLWKIHYYALPGDIEENHPEGYELSDGERMTPYGISDEELTETAAEALFTGNEDVIISITLSFDTTEQIDLASFRDIKGIQNIKVLLKDSQDEYYTYEVVMSEPGENEVCTEISLIKRITTSTKYEVLDSISY